MASIKSLTSTMYRPAKPTTINSYHARVFCKERKTSGSIEGISSTAETHINLNGSTTYSFQAQAQHHLEFLFLTNDELISVIHISHGFGSLTSVDHIKLSSQ